MYIVFFILLRLFWYGISIFLFYRYMTCNMWWFHYMILFLFCRIFMFIQKCHIPISYIQICISIIYKSNWIFFQSTYTSYILILSTVFFSRKKWIFFSNPKEYMPPWFLLFSMYIFFLKNKKKEEDDLSKIYKKNKIKSNLYLLSSPRR